MKSSLNSSHRSKEDSRIEDKTWRGFLSKVRFIWHFAALPWHLSCRVYCISEHRVSSGIAPFIISPSLRHYRIILFYARIFPSVHDPSFPPFSVIQSLPPTPRFLFLYHRFSISRSVVVTFKRNLHNGMVWKSVFSRG